MTFTVNASLLDAIVLSVVSTEDTYGYKITQEVNKIIGVSESTLYPVLRRLQKDSNLEVYDMEYLGRNRRYYKITHKGKILLNLYQEEWEIYKEKIDCVFSKDFPAFVSEEAETATKSEEELEEVEGEYYSETDSLFGRKSHRENKKGSEKMTAEEKIAKLKIGERIDNLKIPEKISSLKLGEKLDNLKIPEKIENLKIGERIDNLKIPEKIENLKIGEKFDQLLKKDHKVNLKEKDTDKDKNKEKSEDAEN